MPSFACWRHCRSCLEAIPARRQLGNRGMRRCPVPDGHGWRVRHALKPGLHGNLVTRTAKSPPATRTRSTRRSTAMAKLGKSKTEKAKQAMGKKTKTEKARAKLAEKTDEAGKKVRKADRKASKKTKKTVKP